MTRILSEIKNYIYKQNNVDIDIFAKLPNKALNSLIEAEETINHYAKANNVKVKFGDARICGFDLAENGDEFVSKYVGIKVQKSKNDTKSKLVIFDEKSDPPFLRKIYETLQELVEGKHSKIRDYTNESFQKLLSEGKIKG